MSIPDEMVERAARAIRGRIGDDLIDDAYCKEVADAALEAALEGAEVKKAKFSHDAEYPYFIVDEAGEYLVVKLP